MSWGGDRKCGAFLSRLDRDPHPTCTRCRGKVCTKDLTCDFCAVWSAEQWELFAKKRSYKERKRPSGSVPLAQQTSPRAETSLGVSRPGTSSSSRPLVGGRGSRRGLGVHLVLCLGGLPLLPLDLGPARGVGVPLGIRLGRVGSLPLLLLLREEEERELPARCRPPFPASPMLLTLPNSHRTFHNVGIRGSHQHLAPAFYPPAVHALRSMDRGRIRGLGHVRVARVDVAVALAPLSRSRARGRERRQRSSPALLSSRARSRRERSRSFDRYRSRRGSSRSRHDRSRSSDRYRSRRDRSRRERSRSFDRYRSRRERTRSPARRGGGGGTTARGRPLSRVARMTARGQAGDYLAHLPACEPRNQDGWPDEKPRRVWRRLPLSLLWFLKPSGRVDDDRSTAFESVDFARDDSFRAVLGLIREFHDMAEPASVPAARCKTSLASAYGLMSESSPAFTLPVSPLLSTLLLDINSDLSKFLEDQTVHGFLPVPGRRHRRYYGTTTSSFPGPYTVPPGVTSITLEKASEVKKRSVSLSASQVSSMETMLSGMCEVSSWLDWWLSTCGGFRDHLPIEVRADFERLMISVSRALEFLASQGCTTLGNLVLARRDALLADVRGTVPVEEVARLRYSPLPQSASIFPHALLDSALRKMRAAASDALVQRTLHPPRIPRKPAESGQSAGSSTAHSGQASTSGASQAQKQSASSSPSGQSGQRKKKGKGKAPFSSSSRGSGRSGGKGKGAGKKSA